MSLANAAAASGKPTLISSWASHLRVGVVDLWSVRGLFHSHVVHAAM